MQTQGKQQGRSVGSTKGEQIHAKGSQNPNRNSKSSRETQNQAHSLETAGSDLHCCTGELNVKSTAHTQENTICLLNQKPKYTFENITNNSLVSQALLQSPLVVFRA